LTAIVAELDRKIVEETKAMEAMYDGLDERVVGVVRETHRLAERNRQAAAMLAEATKMASQSMEYRRRRVGETRSELREAMQSLWVDPDRGNFEGVDWE